MEEHDEYCAACWCKLEAGRPTAIAAGDRVVCWLCHIRATPPIPGPVPSGASRG